MTWSDPIVEEVRRARDAYAARFNYDLRAIYRDLKERERQSSAIPCETTTKTTIPDNRKMECAHADQGHSASQMTVTDRKTS